MTAQPAARPAAPLAENMRSAAYMSASMAALAVNDGILKTFSGELPLFQAVFLRGLIVTLIIGLIAWRRGALRRWPHRRDMGLIGLRSLAEIGATFSFLVALFNIPFANANAIIQSVPLAVTLGAAVVFRERVGLRRYLAIAAGLAGVLVIVRPGAEGFNTYSLWAAVSIFFVVVRDLATRALTPDASVLLAVFMAGLGVTLVAGGVVLFQTWVPVDAGQMLRLAVSAVCLLVGFVFGFMTIRIGEIGFAAPFRYTQLIWAILLGIALFGEWPDLWMLTGSAIIIAAGLYTFHRERRLASSAASGISAPGR